VAEKLVFSEVTSGAAADIRQATAIAKSMVCQWGMSEAVGPLSYTGREEHIFLGRDITRTEDYSPETAREIDLEIRRIIDETERRVTGILTANRDKLELLARKLLEVETLSAQQVYALLGLEFKGVPGSGAEGTPDGRGAVPGAPPPRAPATAPATASDSLAGRGPGAARR
jgi:cell division protease FtsH